MINLPRVEGKLKTMNDKISKNELPYELLLSKIN